MNYCQIAVLEYKMKNRGTGKMVIFLDEKELL